jgi:hypothetical protein
MNAKTLAKTHPHGRLNVRRRRPKARGRRRRSRARSGLVREVVLGGRAIPYRIDRSYDIPYVGGISRDGRTVYVDRKAYPALLARGVLPGLIEHERVEGILLRRGMQYPDANRIANLCHIDRQRDAWAMRLNQTNSSRQRGRAPWRAVRAESAVRA